MSEIDKFPWSTLFLDDVFNYKDGRMMGRQASGNSYLRAIGKGYYNKVSFFLPHIDDKEHFSKSFSKLIKKGNSIDVDLVTYENAYASKDYGGLFIHDPSLGRFADLRSNFGHDEYSIVGITHTTMSDNVINSLRENYTKPVMEWDALICTSKAVKDSVDKINDYQEEYLKDRFNLKKFIKPMFPIIPLGIHSEDFNFTNDFKDQSRKKLNINKNDIVLIFLGRLSFHAKAHPYPMYKALNNLQDSIDDDQKIHLIQAGWFPNDYIKDVFVSDAKNLCPEVICHFIDAREPINKSMALAASDIFISLSDNFQETYGLTPLEAMASGLPVVISDWNGYKDTVRDGIDGFSIPTITLEPGDGQDMAYRYFSQITSYDLHIGYSSQTVGICIDKTTEKLRDLIKNKDLRLKMGKNGKERAINHFDWQKILLQYSDLRDELNNIRQHSAKSIKKNNFIELVDPYNFFSSYSTKKLTQNTVIFSKEGLLSSDHYLFTSNSVNLNKESNVNFKLSRSVVNKIIEALSQDELKIMDLTKKIKLDELLVKKHIIIMIKFDILGYREK